MTTYNVGLIGHRVPIGTTLVPGSYHIVTDDAFTIPDTGLTVGTQIRLTKSITNTPTLTCTIPIVVAGQGSDTVIIYDINAEIILIWNGMSWEI